MERTQFTFYASFAAALRRIRNKAVRCAAYDAICNYALHGELPDMEALPDAAAIAFDLIRPTLDTSARKAASCKQGGSKAEANRKQTAREKEGENEKEGEKEKEKEKEKENECSLLGDNKRTRSAKMQIPPDRDEVAAYCREAGYTVNIDAWFAHYEANGWKVGRNPMKDWKAAVRTWVHNGFGSGAAKARPGTAAAYVPPKETNAAAERERMLRMIADLEAKE